MKYGMAALAAAIAFVILTAGASAGFWGPGPRDFQEVYYQPKVLPSVDEALNTFAKLNKYYTAGYSRSRTIVDMQLSPTEMRYKHVRSWVESGYSWVPYDSGAFVGGHYVSVFGGTSQPWSQERYQESADTIVFSTIRGITLEHTEGATDESYAWRAVIKAKDGEKYSNFWFGTNDPETAKRLIDAFCTLFASTLSPNNTLYLRLGAEIKSQEDAKRSLERTKRPEGTEGLGVVVVSTLSGSPAARAGLKPGDIIYRIAEPNNGSVDIQSTATPWNTLEDAAVSAAGTKPQVTLTLNVIRDGNPIEAAVTVENPNAGLKVLHANMARAARAKAAAAEAASPAVHLGVSGRDLTAVEAQSAGVSGGVYVAGVDAGSLAEQMGAKAGDFLIEINGAPVISTAAMREALAAGTVSKLKVWRAGNVIELAGVEKF